MENWRSGFESRLRHKFFISKLSSICLCYVQIFNIKIHTFVNKIILCTTILKIILSIRLYSTRREREHSYPGSGHRSGSSSLRADALTSMQCLIR